MQRIRSLFLGGIFLVAASLVQAAWPDRQITLVVPFPAGGGTDVVGRIIAKELAQRLRVNVVVENRPGASGNIGARQVSKARPDGDRKSTRLNSSHQIISYAVFCLKKKKRNKH